MKGSVAKKLTIKKVHLFAEQTMSLTYVESFVWSEIWWPTGSIFEIDARRIKGYFDQLIDQ